MNWVGIAGLVMAGIGLVAIAVEVVLILPRAFRLNRELGTLVDLIEEMRMEVGTEIDGLRAAGLETNVLWKPYRRILRWIFHPLTIALYESYRRRRAINGSDRQGNPASPVHRVAG